MRRHSIEDSQQIQLRVDIDKDMYLNSKQNKINSVFIRGSHAKESTRIELPGELYTCCPLKKK
jgi:hypothetical protein